MYDRQAAVQYARRWALKRNPAYYDFEGVGGDCTNFASQCLFAGCGVMNFTRDTGWYYRSSYDRAAAWTSVEYLYAFLTRAGGRGPWAREVTQSQAAIGDIVQLGTANGRFYHSPVIVAVAPVLLIAAHSEDALDRPLADYGARRLRFLHIVDARA